MSSFSKGDLIVVVGVKSDSDGLQTYEQTLASVIAIGKYDLFAISEQTSYRKAMFKVQKKLCKKIEPPSASALKDCNQPKVGDLVVSVVQNYTTDKIECKTGILKEIVDLSWRIKTAKLLVGTKYEDAPYDSLIILEE